MCWQLEKLLKEHDAKLNPADKEAVSKAIEKTREAAKSDDLDRIKSAVHELEQASHALSKTLYEKAGAQAAGAAPGDGGPQPSGQPSGAASRRRRRRHRRGVRGEEIAPKSLSVCFTEKTADANRGAIAFASSRSPV